MPTFTEANNNLVGYIAYAIAAAGWVVIIWEFVFRHKPPQPTTRQQVLDSLGIDEDDVAEDGEAAELIFRR